MAILEIQFGIIFVLFLVVFPFDTEEMPKLSRHQEFQIKHILISLNP